MEKNDRTSYNEITWKKEQEFLGKYIKIKNFDASSVQYVAGVDVAYLKKDSYEYGFCSIVIIDNNNLNVVEQTSYVGKVQVEYVPGFLSFRELPLILEAVKKIEILPDVFIFDGNGLIHPRRMGIATHASFYLKKPCIGVAKSFFRAEDTLTFDVPDNYVGASTNIISSNGEILGLALRTKQDCKPVFISVGNYMSLKNVKDIILRYVTDESRIPRLNHIFLHINITNQILIIYILYLILFLQNVLF